MTIIFIRKRYRLRYRILFANWLMIGNANGRVYVHVFIIFRYHTKELLRAMLLYVIVDT